MSDQVLTRSEAQRIEDTPMNRTLGEWEFEKARILRSFADLDIPGDARLERLLFECYLRGAELGAAWATVNAMRGS